MVDFTHITQHAVSRRRWSLIAAILLCVAGANGGTQLQSKSCTGQQANTNRNSFNFRTFGNASSLEHCVDFCCRDDTCELAIFSRGFHCFGVSCSELKLCHKILDRLLMDDERELQQSSKTTGTKDFIRHTSQVANPRCPQRFVPSFHVLLLGTSPPRAFHKLSAQSKDAGQCSAQCCRSRDCLLSFIEDNECYGVTGHQADNYTERVQEPRIGLQVAIIDRNKEVSRSLDDDDEDPDELGSDDMDNGAPAKPEVATLKSQSKPRQYVYRNEPSAKNIQKQIQTSQNTKASFTSTNSTKRNNDKFSKKKYTLRPRKEEKRTLTSYAHLLHPTVQANVIHSKFSSERGITGRNKVILSPTKGSFSHPTSRALNTNVIVKHTLGHSDVVNEGTNRVRPSIAESLMTVKPTGKRRTAGQRRGKQRSQTEGHFIKTKNVRHLDRAITGTDFEGSKFSKKNHRDGFKGFVASSARFSEGKKEGSSRDYDSSTNRGNEEFSGDDDLSGDGHFSGDGQPSGAVNNLVKGDRDVSGEDEDRSGTDDDVSKGDKDVSGKGEDWSGTDDDLSKGDKDVSGKGEVWSGTDDDLSKGNKDASGKGEDWSGSDDDLSTGDRDASRKGEDWSGTDDDLSTGDKDMSGEGEDRSGTDDDLSKGNKDVSGEGEDWSGTDDDLSSGDKHLTSGDKDLSRDDEQLIGNDEHFSGDFHRVTRMNYNGNQPKKYARKDTANNKTRKTVDVVFLGSSDEGSDKRKGDYGEVQHKTSARKNKENGTKIDLVKDLDNHVKEHLPQQTSASKAIKNSKTTDDKNLKPQKEGNTKKKIDLVEDLDDLGSDDDDNERASKTVARLVHLKSISNTTKIDTKADNKHLKSSKEGNTKGKIDIVEDLDDLGSDDDKSVKSKLGEHNQVTSRKLVRLPQKTNRARSAISKTIKNGRKEDNEYPKSSEEGKTKKIELVEDLDDLGSDDGVRVKSKLGEHSKVTSRNVLRLPQKTNRARSAFAKKSNKKGKKKEIELVKDLDELGMDDDSVASNGEQITSRKNASLTHRTNNETINNNTKASNKPLKSNSGNIHSKPRKKKTKQASSISVKEMIRPKGSVNKFKNISTIESWPSHSSSRNHVVNHKARTLGTTLVKDNAKLQNERGRKTGHDIKAEKKKQHITSNMERTTKYKDELKQPTVRPSMPAKQKYIEPSHIRKSFRQSIKPKVNGINIDKSTESRRSYTSQTPNIIGHHNQTIAVSIKPNKVTEVPPSGEKSKAISNTRPDNAVLKNKATVTRNSKAMVQVTKKKGKTNVKGHITGTTHYNSTSPVSAEKGKNMKTKAVKSSKVQRNYSFQSKETPKQSKTPFKVKGHNKLENRRTFAAKNREIKSKSSSKHEDIDDLMKYAHRKGSVKRLPSVNHQVGRVVPTTKRAAFGKTTARWQGRKKIATDYNKAMQGQRSKSVHPAATKMKDTNLSVGNRSTSNKVFLSIKQRSDKHILEHKDRFLAHFHKEVNDGVGFSIKSGGHHHKGKHSKQDLSIDLEDLGDADFDIMMSNDIPHKTLPEKKKSEERDKHTGNAKEKQSDAKSDSSGKKKKKKKDDEMKKGDNGEESEQHSETRHSSHRHKDKGKKNGVRGRNHRHHHFERTEHDNDKDDEAHSSNNAGQSSKHDGKESHHHSKHGKSDSADQKDSESGHRHKKHRHHAKRIENDNDDDNNDSNDNDSSSVKSDNEKKKIHKHKKNHHHKATNNDESEKDRKLEHHHHHSHKRHQKKYDNNNWVGKIIPGKVKVTYKDDNDKKGHHEHKIHDQKKTTHHKRKHMLEADDNRKSSSEETESKNRHIHSHHKHDDYGKKEEQSSYHENRKKEEEQEKAKNQDNEEKQEHAEKRTDVNYEAIKTGRHRFVHDEEKESHHHDNEEKESHHHDDEDKESHHHDDEDKESHHHDDEDKESHHHDDEDKESHRHYDEDKDSHHHGDHHHDNKDKESHHHDNEDKQNHQRDDSDSDKDNLSKSKNVDKEDEREKSDDNDEEDKANDDHEKEEGPRKETNKNLVVLGEDSENDDDDGEKHSEEIKRRHHGHRHENERNSDKQEDELKRHHSDDKYNDEHHKSTVYNRYEHDRHWESKHRHHESDYESKEADNDNDDQADKRRRNFRKSFIYHKKKEEEQRLKDHHNSEGDREEQPDMEVNSEHKNEDHDRELHVDEHHRHLSRHHFHHPSRHHHDSERDREEHHDMHVNSEHNNEDHDREVYVDKHRHSSRHHLHHHLRLPVDNDRKEKEKYEDRYEPDEVKYHHERQHDEPENFRRHHHVKDHGPNEESEHNYRNFHREEKEGEKEEGRHGDFISNEGDRERWKFKQEHQDRGFEGASRQLDDQDSFDHRFIGEEKPSDNYYNHHLDHSEHRKFKPRHRPKGHWKNRHFYQDREEQHHEDSGGLFDSSSWIPNENHDDEDFYGGEGNHDRKQHRKKHRKYKHRKDRQSYDYWPYGNQNPYYYDYKYHKFRSRYEHYPPQPSHRYDWRNRNRGYDQWKPKTTNWYPVTQQWNRKESWRHHPKWQQSHDNRPIGYQRNTLYDNNGDDRVKNQPKPTSYPRDPSTFLRPTNPRWQRPDTTERGFRGDNWPPDQNRGPGEHYQDWNENRQSGPLNQGETTHGPQQHSPSGFQPQPHPDGFKPNDQTQSAGVQSKYVPPASQQYPERINNKTRFRPTVRRQYPATPPAQVLEPTKNITQIKNIMDKLDTPSSRGGQLPSSVPNNIQNKTNVKTNLPKINATNSDHIQERNRLNGFFNEESAGKKSDILRPINSSNEQSTRNSSVHSHMPQPLSISLAGNTTQHAQQIPLRTTSTPAKLPPQPTQVTNKTTVSHTALTRTTSNHTSKPPQAAPNSSTSAVPTHKSTTELTPAAPIFGDVSQSDDSSETGKKHRKHRAPVCMAGKTSDDVTLLRGKKAGNFTNIGDVGDFDMCIKRCCQHQKCDLAFKSAETCFLVSCFSQESCQTSPSLDDIFSPRMCFVTRHLRDSDKGQDDGDDWNDKVSPSGIHEVCEDERALGILWKKTVAGHYSTHPCPRDAKGFVKRRCEADSRWLPPNFSDCVSDDYQVLYDKSKKLAIGADPSPLIRDLSQLTTQNIDNSLIFGGDLDRATDIMAAIVQHNGQTELMDMTREDVENFVRASSNLLDMTNQQEWFNIQKNKPGTADVLRSMEMFALQAAMRLPREDMSEPTITNNIIIKLDRKSAGEGGLTFPDFSNPRVDRWDARHDVIALPSTVFDRGEASTASISFKSLPYLLPDSNVSTGLGPNSKVISTVMHPHPQGKITPPVTVVLSHIKRRRGNPKCVFWDYSLNPHRGGAWSSRGCWLAFNNQSHSICQCSHLSNFAVLMDLSADESLQKEQKRERTMALMWIGIPVLIVGVIGGLYMSFSWNKKSGIPSTVTRPSTSLNEKTGFLGQRVVTSQVREEFPPSPTRDLYRALSPGYSPTGDLEWQDEFDFDVESGDHRFKQMLLPKLQLLQNQLINEFYDADKMETKKKLLQSKIQTKPQITADSPVQCEAVRSENRQTVEEKTQMEIDMPVQCETVDRQTIRRKPIKIDKPVQKRNRQTRTSSGKYLRVRFADDCPPGRNLTDEDKERFKRLQRMERRVFAQHLSRWTANSHLNLSE